MTLFSDPLKRAAVWLDENHAEFHLSHARTIDEQIQLIKPIGELALTSSVLAQLGYDRSWCTSKINDCWQELECGELLLRILAARPDLIVAATLYSSFYEFGMRHDRLERLLIHLSQSPACNAIEFPTWRRLDVAHGFQKLGLHPFPLKPHSDTWLSALPEPWMISDDIAYAITHEIFYITDFGNEIDRLDRNVRNYVSAWLPAWLEIYANMQNWDLYAEFLMVSGCVGCQYTDALELLLSTQQPQGLFLGPQGSAANFLNRDTTEKRTEFLQNYHTTLVGMMAIAFCNNLSAIKKSTA